MCVLAVWATLILFAGSRAEALDPRKSLPEYVLDQWDGRHGLPFSTVRAIQQTPDGSLWLSTQSGLVRFDGAQFTVFDAENTPQIPNDRLWPLAKAPDGRLWIGTIGGLSSWHNDAFESYVSKGPAFAADVRSLLLARDGSLWMGTAIGGLVRWRGGSVEIYGPKDGLSGDSVFALAEDPSGDIWVGSSRGLDRFSGGTLRHEGAGSELVWTLLLARDGSLWIGTEGAGLLRRKPDGRLERFNVKDGMPGNEVRTLLEDRDGNLWVGTNNGLGRFSGGRWSRLAAEHGLSSDLVRSLFEDADRNLWIGFYGSGLSRLRDGEFTSLTSREGLVHDLAWGAAEAPDGSLWIGTQGGVSHLKDGKWTSYTTANGLQDDIARALIVDRRGVVWVGSRGVTRMENGRFRAVLEDKVVQTLYETRDGAVWFGTLSGLYRLHDGKLDAYQPSEPARSEISVIHEDRQGTLWVGATRGLSRLVDGRLVPFQPEAPWSSFRVEVIHEDRDGALWVATDGGGLFRVAGETHRRITMREGLLDDTVTDLLEDDDANFWLGTPRGIFRLGRDAIDDFLAGRAGRVHGRVFGMAHGLKSSECTGGGSGPGGLKDRQGRLLFPTTKGIAVIDPRTVPASVPAPVPYLEEVRFDRVALRASGPVEAGPGRGDLELRFGAVDFVSPGNLRFRYRLEGFDPAWVEAGDRRVAHYTNLVPRRYRFLVEASNDGVSWSPNPATVDVRLRPHYHQTREFRALVLLAVVLGALGLHRLRVRRLARRAAELVRINEALHESEERYAVAAKGANDGLFDWNLKTGRVYYSPRWKAMIGHEDAELRDSPAEWLDRVHPEDRPHLQADLDAHLEGRSPHFENEHRIRHKDGSDLFVLSRGLVVKDAAGQNARLAGSQTDITLRKQAEAQILHDALHDPLTGFPNRTLFLDRLGQAVARRRRRDGYHFAVLFVDLDRFKLVNDSLGHLAGDALLVGVAKRLGQCLRGDDTVARLGGDEFAMLLDDVKDVGEATHVAERIQKEMRQPFPLGGHDIFATVSVGITVDSARDRRPEELLRDADTAMYRAKARGRDRYEVFDEEMHARAVAALTLETDLRRALERGELRLLYQPIVDLKRGAAVAFEALLRWQHPVRGLLSPDEFIPLAEETGLIVAFGHWVLREACTAVRSWRASLPAPSAAGLPVPAVSVNVSVRQFSQDDLVERIEALLHEFALPAGSLRLEITESLILGDPEAAVVRCLALRELGVAIDIDDFGTGYSSLSHLRRLPVDTLKIDRSFVSNMLEQAGASEIVRAIVSLAGTLGIGTVAEGVETAEQLARLKELGCQNGQGYLFAKPMARPEAFARTTDLA